MTSRLANPAASASRAQATTASPPVPGMPAGRPMPTSIRSRGRRGGRAAGRGRWPPATAPPRPSPRCGGRTARGRRRARAGWRPVARSSRRARARLRSARARSHRLPFSPGAAPDLALVVEALGLELEARQAPGLGGAHPEAQALVRLGELAADLLQEVPVGGRLRALGELDEHLDLVADAVDRVEADLELLEGADVAAHDLLDRARVDVGAAHDLHVVDAAADAAVVDVERAPAVAARRRHAHDHVAGAVAHDRDEAAPERGHHPLAELAVGHRLERDGVDDLLDEVV